VVLDVRYAPDKESHSLAHWIRELATLLEMTPDEETESWSVGETEVETLAIEDGPTIHVAQLEAGRGLVSPSRAFLTRVLTRRSARLARGASGVPADSLAASSSFKDVRSGFSRDGDEALIVLNAGAFLDMVRKESGDPEVDAVIKALGVDRWRALAGAVRFRGERIETRGMVLGEDPARGLLEIVSAEPLSRPFLDTILDGTAWASATRIDLARILSLVEEMHRIDGAPEDDPIKELEALLATKSVTVEKAVGAFTGELAVFVRTSPVLVGPPEACLVVGVKNREIVRGVVPALLEGLGIEFTSREQEWGDLIEITLPGELPFGAVSLALLDDKLLVHMGTAATPVRLLISQLRSGGKSLLDTPRFLDAKQASGLSDKVSHLSFLDVPRLVQILHGLSGMGLGMLPEEQRAELPVDPMAIPRIETIVQYLGASVSFGLREKGSYLFTGSSSIGPEIVGGVVLGAVVFPTVQNAMGKAQAAVEEQKRMEEE
jgi:hypothetical protein